MKKSSFPLRFHLSSCLAATFVAALYLYPNVVPPFDRYYQDYSWYGWPFKIFYKPFGSDAPTKVHSNEALCSWILIGLTLIGGTLVGLELFGHLRRGGAAALHGVIQFIKPSNTTRWLFEGLVLIIIALNVIPHQHQAVITFGWPHEEFVYEDVGKWYLDGGYPILTLDCYIWLGCTIIPCIACESVIRKRRKSIPGDGDVQT